MRIAKAVAQENTACLSRKLGAIIVDSKHKVKGVSYNGVPQSLPHADTCESLENYFWPQLTSDDIESIGLMYDLKEEETIKKKFLEMYTDRGTCPRKLLGCGTGDRPLLCNCTHAEVNCITNAACDVSGCVMYCYSPIPCINCAGTIINARIAEVHCLDVTYHEQSLWMFEHADIALVTYGVDDLID